MTASVLGMIGGKLITYVESVVGFYYIPVLLNTPEKAPVRLGSKPC